MLFLDSSVMCADIMTTALSATFIENLTDTIVKNAMVDEVYMSNDLDTDTSSSTIPSDWGFDTVFHAKFEGTVIGGDVDFLISSVNGFLIKRNEIGEFDWLTIDFFPIKTLDDFVVTFQDRTAALGKNYQYAFVPMLNGIEGSYSKTTPVYTSDTNLVILDKNEVWSTAITDGFCDTTRTYPVSMINTLNSRYPTTVRNTIANFDTITVSGMWLPNEDGSECEIIDVNDTTNIGFITKWNKQFIDFLTNDNDKVLKNVDGRMWLCHLSSDVTDSADTVYNKRKLNFTMTEVGDVYSSEDLCESGLIDDDTEPYW